MNDKAKKLAKELNLFPTIPVSEDELPNLDPDACFMSRDGYVQNDYSVSDDEIMLIAELQKCKNIMTIKDILAAEAAIFIVLIVAFIIYFLFKITI